MAGFEPAWCRHPRVNSPLDRQLSITGMRCPGPDHCAGTCHTLPGPSCPQKESNPHPEIRSLVSSPLDHRGKRPRLYFPEPRGGRRSRTAARCRTHPISSRGLDHPGSSSGAGSGVLETQALRPHSLSRRSRPLAGSLPVYERGGISPPSGPPRRLAPAVRRSSGQQRSRSPDAFAPQPLSKRCRIPSGLLPIGTCAVI